MKVCYHGTDDEAAHSILDEGFRIGTFFSAHLEDALCYGGLHVFSVVFNNPPDHWQFTTGEIVPSDAILNYTIYQKTVIVENKKIREKLWESTREGMEKDRPWFKTWRGQIKYDKKFFDTIAVMRDLAKSLALIPARFCAGGWREAKMWCVVSYHAIRLNWQDRGKFFD